MKRRQFIQQAVIVAGGLPAVSAAADQPRSLPRAARVDNILVNHVGFLPSAYKSFVIPEPPSNEFSIHLIDLDRVAKFPINWLRPQPGDSEPPAIYHGKLRRAAGSELGPGWIGEFTDLRDEGIYQIWCGRLKSRIFVVYRGVYDYPLRVLFNYFSSQRCGNSLTGWHAPCHLRDGRIAETGEHKDLTGGWHQSCDLRKWHDGLVYGVMGLTQLGLLQSPRWDNGLLADEIKWGCDFFHKVIRPDGGLMQTANLPLGWGEREWYLSDAVASAQWNTISSQAMAARYFENRDPEYARRCLAAARRVWTYMTERRPNAPHKIPKIPPRGHEIYGMAEPLREVNSAPDFGYRVLAGLNLYRTTGENQYLLDCCSTATKLTELQLGSDSETKDPAAAWFWHSADTAKLADLSPDALIGLAELVQMQPSHSDAEKWKRCVQRFAEHYRIISERNAWGRIPISWSLTPKPATRDWGPVPVSRPGLAAGSRMSYRLLPNYIVPYMNLPTLAAGLFLIRAARVTGNQAYENLAQRQLDWVMGCNGLDSSTAEGIGNNQPHRGVFGDGFFPPTPQIPGAVSTGLIGDENDELLPINSSAVDYGFYGYYFVEYDMPPTALMMWLVADLCDADVARCRISGFGGEGCAPVVI